MLDVTNAISESKIVNSLRRSAPRIGVSWTMIDRTSRLSGTSMQITLDLSANHDAEAALSNLGILSRWCKVQQARHTPKHSPNRIGDRFSEGLSIGAAAEIPRSHRPFGQHPLDSGNDCGSSG